MVANKVDKRGFIFAFILIQTALAITCGLLVLHITTKNTIPQYAAIENVRIGGMSNEAAVKKLEQQFSASENDHLISIQYGDGDEFAIPYNDIGVKMDYQATVDLTYKREGTEMLAGLINGYFIPQNKAFHPVVFFNENKLKDKVDELAMLAEREPINANVYLKDDRVIKVPEVNGIRINKEKTLSRLEQEIKSHFGGRIVVVLTENNEIETLNPEILSERLKGADEVIASFATDISPANEEAVNVAATAINKVLLDSADSQKDKKGGIFSFNKYLRDANALKEQNIEGYNQVASTLYATVLSAGIRQDRITRTPHNTSVDYIEPGLDTVVFGSTVDFKFENTLDSKLVIFAQVKNHKLWVSLVGEKKDSRKSMSVKVEIEQRFEPSRINTESQDLRKGEQRIVSPGKEGLKVNVYLLTFENGAQTDKKLLYSDKYSAQEAIVQVGPGVVIQGGQNSGK